MKNILQILKKINNSRLSLIILCLLICLFLGGGIIYFIMNVSTGYGGSIHEIEKKLNITVPFSNYIAKEEVYYIYRKSLSGYYLELYGKINTANKEIILTDKEFHFERAPFAYIKTSRKLPDKVVKQFGFREQLSTSYILGNVNSPDNDIIIMTRNNNNNLLKMILSEKTECIVIQFQTPSQRSGG